METVNRVKGLVNEEAVDSLNPEKWVEGGTRESVIDSFFKGRVKVKDPEPKTLFKAGDEAMSAGKKLIKAFSKHGITAVPFCVHQGKDQLFTVQGSNFKWHVIPMEKYKEVVNMPDKEWESLKKLEVSGIKHNGVFIALPLDSMAVLKIEAELRGMTEKVGAMILLLCALPFLPLIALGGEHKDPVLLVKFPDLKEGDLFLEIGRWE